jgi:transcriptional regulator with XRE-family HTH domain
VTNLRRIGLPNACRRQSVSPLANRLQQLREARGLTLRDLAARAGTSNQQVSHLELGKRQLTTSWLKRLAEALGCHPWEIVEDGPGSDLTDRERLLLVNFRRLSEEQQTSLLAEITP